MRATDGLLMEEAINRAKRIPANRVASHARTALFRVPYLSGLMAINTMTAVMDTNAAKAEIAATMPLIVGCACTVF